MPSLNKVILMGNLTRNPEQRFIPSGSAVCDFAIAMNRKITVNNQERDETVYVDVQVWGKQAENVARYCAKGSCVFIEGRLALDQWSDRNTGEKKSKMKVVADRVQFIGGRTGGNNENGNGNGYNSRPQSRNQNRNPQPEHRYTRQDAQPPVNPAPDPEPTPPPEQPYNPDDDVPF